jgi:hypothetical protein
MAEQEHVSGKTGSDTLQGYIAIHVHTAETQGYQKARSVSFFTRNTVLCSSLHQGHQSLFLLIPHH